MIIFPQAVAQISPQAWCIEICSKLAQTTFLTLAQNFSGTIFFYEQIVSILCAEVILLKACSQVAHSLLKGTFRVGWPVKLVQLTSGHQNGRKKPKSGVWGRSGTSAIENAHGAAQTPLKPPLSSRFSCSRPPFAHPLCAVLRNWERCSWVQASKLRAQIARNCLC